MLTIQKATIKTPSLCFYLEEFSDNVIALKAIDENGKTQDILRLTPQGIRLARFLVNNAIETDKWQRVKILDY